MPVIFFFLLSKTKDATNVSALVVRLPVLAAAGRVELKVEK